VERNTPEILFLIFETGGCTMAAHASVIIELLCQQKEMGSSGM
jgi:hypothetical protein